MVTIQSLIKVADKLVPVEVFEGPILDEDYIEGALELAIDQRPILRREMVDYVDQLWAYLVNGLEEVVAGQEFTTGYPDMPIDIVLRPDGERISITLSSGSHKWDASASATTADLVNAFVPAGIQFFERLRPHAPSHQEMYDRYIAALARLGRSHG